jgi:hypothetical protein
MPYRPPLVICALATLACSKADRTTFDTTVTVSATSLNPSASATAAANVSLAQMIGTWHGKSMPEHKDTVLGTWTLQAPADSSKWTVTMSNGQTIPLHVVAIAGDSVVSQLGPYKNAANDGQVETIRSVTRIRADKIVGIAETRLASNPDSVVRVRLEGTK